MGFSQNNTILIIDGDAICYICGKESLEDSINATNSMMNSIYYKFKNKASSYYLLLSEKPYFRKLIYPEYKSQRKQEPSPFIEDIKSHLRSVYHGISFPGLEADDIATRLKHKLGDRGILCSTDKDVLYGNEGEWLNYKKMEIGYTNSLDKLSFFYHQLLVGDSADNIKGCPRIGVKKSQILLEDCGNIVLSNNTEYNDEMMGLIELCYQNKVREAYLKYYKDEEEALKQINLNIRLIKLLKTDEEYIEAVGYVPLIGEPYPILINY